MTSRELLALALEIQKATNAENRLIRFLGEISATFQTFIPLARAVFTAGSGVDVTPRNAFSTALKEAGKKARDVVLWDIFSDVKELSAQIQAFVSPAESPLQYDAERLLALLTRFVRELENSWRTHDLQDVYTLYRHGDQLHGELITLRTCAEIIVSSLAPAGAAKGEDEESLSLYLPGDNDLAGFARKLSAVANLYAEFCELIEVSSAEYPLKIIKVESGTTWMDIMGSSAVIQFMILAITAGAHYLYQRYSREGGISEIPKSADAIERLLKIEEELSKRGMDTGPLRERIMKVSIKVAENLGSLLDGEQEIEINGAPHPTTPKRQPKLIRGRAILKLKENTSGEMLAPNQATGPAQDQPT